MVFPSFDSRQRLVPQSNSCANSTNNGLIDIQVTSRTSQQLNLKSPALSVQQTKELVNTSMHVAIFGDIRGVMIFLILLLPLDHITIPPNEFFTHEHTLKDGWQVNKKQNFVCIRVPLLTTSIYLPSIHHRVLYLLITYIHGNHLLYLPMILTHLHK